MPSPEDTPRAVRWLLWLVIALLPLRGWDTVTVPGAVSAWMALSQRFGKLPFADLMAPAIELAERGYAVPVVVQQKWAAATPELGALPAGGGAKELDAFVRSESGKWAAVIKTAGIKLD